MAKITPEEQENLNKLIGTLPPFPFTKETGEPIKFKFQHGGEYILKHWDEFSWMEKQGLIKKRDIKVNHFYVIEKEMNRDPAKILRKAHLKDKVKEAYEKYEADFKTWGKWMVDNNTKIIENKN